MERYLNIPSHKSQSPFFTSRSPPINLNPFRTIQITPLTDDFYTNLLTWNRNIIAYATTSIQFFFLNSSKTITLNNNIVSSLAFSSDGSRIAAGCVDGTIAVTDVVTQSTNFLSVHRSRVGVVRWCGDSILSGSKDRTIRKSDTRSGRSEHLGCHRQEVCGLRLNSTESFIATGGNDNDVGIFDLRLNKTFLFIRSHIAAVKALSWSPNTPYALITGGGTADRKIKMWDVQKGANLVREIDSGSQVCNLHWCNSNRIVSTHGYAENDSRVFNGSLKVLSSNRGHRARVVHFAMSGDEKYYVTGSAESVLNVWKMDGAENEEVIF